WLMYEYVEGGTLAEAVREWRPLPLPRRLGRAVRTLRAIAGALGRFHRLDPPLIHRDLKPQNVLMTGKTPRLTDFGIGGAAVAAGRCGARRNGRRSSSPVVHPTRGAGRGAPPCGSPRSRP